MVTQEDFANEINAQIDRAAQQGRPHVEINAGELHRLLGGYPGPNHRMPVCCEAMRKIQEPSDKLVFSPPEGNGASLTVRYSVPRA